MAEPLAYEHALVCAMAQRCGLIDPDAYARMREAEGRTLRRGLHGTGRTTYLLLAAMVAFEAGCKVEIVARSHYDIGRILRELAGRIGWEVGRWEGRLRILEPNAPLTDGWLRLVDHDARKNDDV